MTRLSINIDETHYRQFRLACLQRGFTMSDLIRAFIAETLHRWRKEDATTADTSPEEHSS